MRKSTLITTIAMIVVVVVALSTATFAWFSSATNTIATANVSTTAAADWSIIYVKPTAPDKADPAVTTQNVTLNGAAKNSVTLNSGMLGGLFAPSAAITTTINKSTAAVTLSNLATFYDATVANDGTVTCGTVYNGLTNGADLKMPDVIRVSNTKQQELPLQLNIVINVGQSTDSSATLLAGAAVRFYIQGAFKHNTSTNTTPNIQDGTIKISNTYQYKEAVAASTPFTGDATPSTKTSHITSELSYADAGTGAGYTQDTEGDPALGIAADDYVKTYTIDIGKIPAGQSANFVIYTWLDGWVADSAAAGASLTVQYAFTTKT